MKEALLDTDTVSYFLRKTPNVVAKVEAYAKEFGVLNISVITFYEITNGLLAKDAKKQLGEFEALLSYVNVLPVSLFGAKIAASICANLRLSGNLIGHNDILIAGTAIENDMKLITNNQKDFSRVPGLDFESWA